jgi:hypothetical protein
MLCSAWWRSCVGIVQFSTFEFGVLGKGVKTGGEDLWKGCGSC